MSWLALHRSEAADELQRHHPNAMLLLTLIARRARFAESPCPVHGLEFGEARIGDHEAAGLSRQEYRTALDTLEKRNFVTTKRTTKGTIARIVTRDYESSIYSISQHSFQPSTQPTLKPDANQQPTNSQPLNKKDTKKEGNKGKGTLSEVQDFVVSIGLPLSDGDACFHKWEGNGWVNGKAKIKDWKATIRSWQAAGYMPSQKNHTPTSGKHSSQYGL